MNLTRGCRFRACVVMWGATICVIPTLASGQTTCETAHVSASVPHPFQCFGFVVAIDGQTALIGAKWDNEDGGAAYVFEFDGTMWSQTQKLLASDGGNEFGRAVAIDGDTVMVGSLQHVHGDSHGAVYVFNKRDGAWVETQEILNGIQFDGFSYSIDIHGDIAVIGARSDDEIGTQAGAAYVYRFDAPTGQWVQEQKLLASDGVTGDFFGWSVAISGGVVVVGANSHDSTCGGEPVSSAGAAYVFRQAPAVSQAARSLWVEEQKLVAPDCDLLDHFGESVSLSGDVAVIGAKFHVHAGNLGRGAAYVFRYDRLQSTWLMEQELLASDGLPGDDFGKSVAVAGDVALIGAWRNDTVGPSFGAAYVFRLVESRWIEQDKLLPIPGAWTAFFGQSVALSGDLAVVGANGENTQSGSAYLYAGLLGLDCNANGISDSCDILAGDEPDGNGDGVPDACVCPWDLDGSTDVGIVDFLALLAAWGTNPGGPPDFDGDGNVGILDFLALLTHWGPCP